MIFVYLWIYIAFLIWIWTFYAVARMHTMKFKNFSTHIEPMTNFLMILLIILSIAGFVLIFSLNSNNSTYTIQTEVKNTISEKKYEKEIGTDYY